MIKVMVPNRLGYKIMGFESVKTGSFLVSRLDKLPEGPKWKEVVQYTIVAETNWL